MAFVTYCSPRPSHLETVLVERAETGADETVNQEVRCRFFFYPDTFIQTDDLNYWSRPIKSRSFYPDFFIQSWSRPLKSRPFYPDHVIQFWSKFSLSSFLIQSLNPDPWSVQIFVITASHPRPPLWSGQEAGVSDLSQGKEIDNSFIRHPFLTFA